MHVFKPFWELFFLSMLGLTGISGMLAFASPRAFAAVAHFSGKLVTMTPARTPFDRWVSIDEYVLRHSRFFGFLVTASVGYLWLLSEYGPQSISKPFLLLIVGVSLGTGIVALVEIRKQKQQLDNRLLEAHTDALTSLANRRSFDIDLARRIAQRQRLGTPLSLLMIDVDHFKRINDTKGHHGGDGILIQVAQLLAKNSPGTSVVGRIGGDEFAVLLGGTELTEAAGIAENLRTLICNNPFVFDGVESRVTISVGLAEALSDDDATSLIKRADSALYAAKEAGRNRSFRQGNPEPMTSES